MSAGSRGIMATTTTNTSQPGKQQQQGEQDSFSVVVQTGRDNWAGEVIENVVGSEVEEHHQPPAREDNLSQVENKILQKKRLFHASRCLELKNLPDGVRDEVKYLYTKYHQIQLDNCTVTHQLLSRVVVQAGHHSYDMYYPPFSPYRLHWGEVCSILCTLPSPLSASDNALYRCM